MTATEPSIGEVRRVIDAELKCWEEWSKGANLVYADAVMETLRDIQRAAAPKPESAEDLLYKVAACSTDYHYCRDLARKQIEVLEREGYRLVHRGDES